MKTKKIIATMMAMTMIMSIAACSKKDDTDTTVATTVNEDTFVPPNETTVEVDPYVFSYTTFNTISVNWTNAEFAELSDGTYIPTYEVGSDMELVITPEDFNQPISVSVYKDPVVDGYIDYDAEETILEDVVVTKLDGCYTITFTDNSAEGETASYVVSYVALEDDGVESMTDGGVAIAAVGNPSIIILDNTLDTNDVDSDIYVDTEA